jgi:hypothetical protein
MLSKSTVAKGEDVTVTWKASNQTRTVLIEVNGSELYRGAITGGQKTFTAQESGIVSAIAMRDDKASSPASVQLTVNPPVVAAEPEITNFDIQPRSVGAGQTITVKYKFNDAVTKATLVPRGLVLDPKIDSVQFEIDTPGDVSYYILAENADGKTIKSRALSVKVQQLSEAAVIVFRAEPANVGSESGGTVKLTWQLANAVRAEINDGVSTKPLPDIKGEMDVEVLKSTQFTLIGYDSKGVTVKQKISVTVKAPPPAPTTSGDQGTDTVPPPSTSTGGGQ